MGSRIRARLDELGWKQRDLLDRVPDLEVGTLSALIARDSRKSEFSEEIAEALGVTHRWLTSGQEPKHREDPDEAPDLTRPGDPVSSIPSDNSVRLRGRALTVGNVEPATDIRRTGVPVILWAQAASYSDGLGTGSADELDSPRVYTTRPHGERAYALRVRGDSMLNAGGDDSFRDGDIILVDPDREARHRSLVVVQLPGDTEAVFKQLLIDGSRRYLQALNPQWPNRVIEMPAGARICGVVFALERAID